MNHEECLICGAPLEYLEQDTLLQTRLLPFHPLRHRFREGAFRHRDGETAHRLPIFGPQQPVHRREVSVFACEIMNYNIRSYERKEQIGKEYY